MFGDTITGSEVGVAGAIAFLAIDKLYQLFNITLTQRNGNALASDTVKHTEWIKLEVEVTNMKDSITTIQKESHEMNTTLSELVGKFDMINKPVRRRIKK